MKNHPVQELVLGFTALANHEIHTARYGSTLYEFHIAKSVRQEFGLEKALFSSSGNVVFADFYAARLFAAKLNERIHPAVHPERVIKAGKINAMALVDEILHAVCELYRQTREPKAFETAYTGMVKKIGKAGVDTLLLEFTTLFPPATGFDGDPKAWLEGKTDGTPRRLVALEELLMLRLANENPAFEPFRFLFDDNALRRNPDLGKAMDALEDAFSSMPHFGPDDQDLVSMLKAPVEASPYSIAGQLDYIRRRWGLVIGQRMRKLLGSVDMLAEEEKPFFPGPGPARVLSYENLDHEYERFSKDRDWMPRVVMIAKSTLVWLDQLSKAYGRPIQTLDAIPDEELDTLSSRGFNALWLIGLWERSAASRRIKELCGNPEAAASAYSLFDYEIAGELGGWPALENLRRRAEWRGIRMAADMVPNHTGLDSAWIRDRPDLFIQRDTPPFPGYSFHGENLSGDGRIGIWLEDHYYSRQDAAVVFKRTDFATGKTTYIYHGNDGTSMPWNDTAQIDFIKPEAREAVRERILHVARNFPIIRFDAAMIMAKRHFRRLWYPEPGHGGDIASRGECALAHDEFDGRMPEEFWREVVDMCAAEAPDTLLLAEAFWMMEGYFVRTLGMHRVYNSAFMNMLKNKENRKYRETIKNTQEFDKDILKRFVNFMNNPDEETAVAQFGKDDHYFGVCTLMATMPGLPMFGHGQVEGLTEKYGMEYRKAYKDESPDNWLVQRHEHEIFPLLKRRYLFSGVDKFLLFDLVRHDGSVDENVFAFTNGHESERALVLFNNAWESSSGWIKNSCSFAEKSQDGTRTLVRKTLAEGLGLESGADSFTVMREQRSGLWFIRRSDELIGDGMFIMLNGFQCQVFLDIGNIRDDGLGTYARLCRNLAGRGVPDLSAALQDLALEELYTTWNALYGSQWFASLLSEPGLSESTRPSAGTKPVKVPAESEERKAFTEFCRVAVLFMDGISGIKESTVNESARATRVVKQGLAAKKALAALLKDGKPESKPAKADSAKPVAASLAGQLAAHPGAREALACFASLVSISALLGDPVSGQDARAVVDHWCLDRKLREAMQVVHVHGDDAWHATNLAKAMLTRLDTQAMSGWSFPDIAASIPGDPEWSRLLGLNLWDGVTWFNAEAFRTAATFTAAASLVWSAAKGTARPGEGKAVQATLDTMLAQAEASGWDYGRFVELIQPLARKPKSGKAVGGKPVAKTAKTAKPAAKLAKATELKEKKPGKPKDKA
ncbi:MAG: alpha-amylase family glycosyl hydrolase [Clostridia bacterium]